MADKKAKNLMVMTFVSLILLLLFFGVGSAQPTPSITITTDKTVYHTGDTQVITITVNNPTGEPLAAFFLETEIFWGIWIQPLIVLPYTQAPNSTQTINFTRSTPFPPCPNCTYTEFDATLLVALFNTTPPYNLICWDFANWRWEMSYSANGETMSGAILERTASECLSSGLSNSLIIEMGKVIDAEGLTYVGISERPDPIRVTKLPEEQTLKPGDFVFFVIETNATTNQSTLYIITRDTLPRGLDYLLAFCLNNGMLPNETYYDPSTGETVLTWNHTARGDFKPGDNATWYYLVLAMVNASVPPCTTLVERVDAYAYLTDGVADDHDETRVEMLCPVPAFSPLGHAALVGLMSIIATSTMVRKRKKR